MDEKYDPKKVQGYDWCETADKKFIIMRKMIGTQGWVKTAEVRNRYHAETMVKLLNKGLKK